MSRISNVVSSPNRRKLLVPFLTVGFPTFEQSLQLARTAIDSGADMLELGMPFSDPLADGPDIQFSSHVALQNGITLRHSLDLAAELRKSSTLPLILMGYYNPLLAFGLSKFVEDAAASGVDGLIIPDLPVEEAEQLRNLMSENGLSAIYLAAPTSSPARITLINKHSTDFVYAVTVTGVTGGGSRFDDTTDSYLSRLRKQLTKPFVAGFGVADGTSARRLTRIADGVVVGSAIIRQIDPEPSSQSRNIAQVGQFLAGIRQSIDNRGEVQD